MNVILWACTRTVMKKTVFLSLSVKGECVPVLTTVSPANDRMDFIKQQIRFSIWITCPRHKTSVYTSGFKSLQSDKTLCQQRVTERTEPSPWPVNGGSIQTIEDGFSNWNAHFYGQCFEWRAAWGMREGEPWKVEFSGRVRVPCLCVEGDMSLQASPCSCSGTPLMMFSCTS